MRGLDRIAFCELKGCPDPKFFDGARREYISQAARLFNAEIFRGRHSTPEMIRVMDRDPEYHTIVALDQRIGLMGAGVLRYCDYDDYASIDWVAVSEVYHGQGLGTRIIKLLEGILVEDSNIRNLRIFPTTTRSLELYARLGYAGDVAGKAMKKTLPS